MKDVKRFRRSFRYAYEGIKYALSTQQNMQFHFCAAVIMLMLALLFGLPKTELLFVLLSVTLVIVCELLNTAIERAVDLAMPDRHPLAKIAKDVAAAAVLVSAVFAAIVETIVFYEPISRLFLQAGTSAREWTPELIWALVALAALCVIAMQTLFSRRRKGGHMMNANGVNENELIRHAISARDRAYVPYSGFRVGSALLDRSGRIHYGCNVENAAYGPTNCAERTALFRAIADGEEPGAFVAIAVVGDTEGPITPCGVCRQVLTELCAPEMPVIMANLRGDIARSTVSALLPGAFGPKDLTKNQ